MPTGTAWYTARSTETRALHAMGIQRCCGCKILKPHDEFHRTSKTRHGRVSRCRDCRRTEAKINYHQRGGKQRGRQVYLARQEYYIKARYQQRLKSLYGLDEATMSALEMKQDGRCGICLRRFEDTLTPKRLAQRPRHIYDVDHDHTTGLVRGLLCHRCNTALGYLADGNDTDLIWRLLRWIGDPVATAIP